MKLSATAPAIGSGAQDSIARAMIVVQHINQRHQHPIILVHLSIGTRTAAAIVAVVGVVRCRCTRKDSREASARIRHVCPKPSFVREDGAGEHAGSFSVWRRA